MSLEEFTLKSNITHKHETIFALDYDDAELYIFNNKDPKEKWFVQHTQNSWAERRNKKTMQLITMASDSPSSSSTEQSLHKIIGKIRELDRQDIKYRFTKEEITNLIGYLIFEEK